MKKRLLSGFLCLCMLLTLAPVAFAAEPASTENEPVASTEPATPQEPTTNDDSASVEGNQGTTESAKGTKDNPFTTVEEYNAAVKENDKNGEDVYLTIQGTEGNPIIFGTKNTDADTLADNSAQYDTFALTNTQSRANPPKLHLTLEWCEFYGNTANDQSNSSFMYLPNCQSLTIDNCKFDTGTSGLKYGINWNLCGIQNSVVSITNSTFTGTYTKNALKLNQRNGADDVATDVKLRLPALRVSISPAVPSLAAMLSFSWVARERGQMALPLPLRAHSR